jgi:hypothetical protein
MEPVKQYVVQLLIALDQLFNALLGGYADETLSSRSWRAEQKGLLAGRIFRPAIDALFFFDVDHCKSAFESELARAHMPGTFRELLEAVVRSKSPDDPE